MTVRARVLSISMRLTIIQIFLYMVRSSLAADSFNASEIKQATSPCPADQCVSDSSTCTAGVTSSSCSVGHQCCVTCNKTCQAIDDWFQLNRDNFCISIGGDCKHDTNTCHGSYEVGMCGGPTARKCCVPPGTFSVPIPHFIVQTILLLGIIILNVLVITVTLVDKELHNIPNVGISSLALADLLLAIAWFIIQVLVFHHATLITNIDKNLRHIQDLAFVFEMSVILHILLITIDRYCAILHPIKHYKVVKAGSLSTLKVVFVCILVWSIAAFLAYTRRFSKEWTNCHMTIIMNISRTILPLTLTAVLNIKIFYVINKRINEDTLTAVSQMTTKDTENVPKKMLQNKKAMKTISLILLCIMMSYVPLRIITMLSVCGPVKGLYESLSNYIIILKFINSITNPIIYMLTTRQFKKSIGTLLLKFRVVTDPSALNPSSGHTVGSRKISLTGSTTA